MTLALCNILNQTKKTRFFLALLLFLGLATSRLLPPSLISSLRVRWCKRRKKRETWRLDNLKTQARMILIYRSLSDVVGFTSKKKKKIYIGRESNARNRRSLKTRSIGRYKIVGLQLEILNFVMYKQVRKKFSSSLCRNN